VEGGEDYKRAPAVRLIDVAAITWDLLRDLARLRPATECAISIYVDLDPSVSPTASALETQLHSLLSQAEKLVEGYGADNDCRKAAREDVERLRRWLTDDFDRDGTRGLAVFASSRDGLFRTFPLGERVADAVRIGRDLYLRPLTATMGRGDGVLVAVVSREQGRVFRLHDGRLVEEVDDTQQTRGQHEQGGLSQARYQRHIDKLVHDHLKTVGGELDRRTRAAGELGLVVVAPHELRAEIDGMLSSEARAALIGWTTAESHAGAAELFEIVRPLVDAARARRERETVERWREERGQGGRAAAGWAQTMTAAADGRVDVLLLEETESREAWQCPRCARGSADGGACPLDGETLDRRADGADLAVHGAVAHGGTVLALGAGMLGDAEPMAEGIGALLRF
jgi:peptide chain release factor subunit 1